MANNLAKVLKADMPRLPLRKAAEELRKRGRGRDTMLAHITPREAAMLKAKGGSGTINPDTGLPEFDDGFDFSGLFDSTPIAQQGVDFSAPSYTPETITQAPVSYAGPDYTTGLQNVQTVQDGSLYQTPVYNTFEQPFQAAQYGGGFQQDLGGGFTIPGQYAFSNPYVQNAYRTAGQPLPADIAAKAYGETSPVEFVQSGSARDDALTLQMLGGQNAPVVAGTANQITPPGTEDRQYSTPEDIDKETMDRLAAADAQKTAAAKGIQTPLGTIGLKEALALGGLGLGGLSYLNAQNQAKKYAATIQNAANTAAQQQTQLAQPYMTQGGQQLATAVQGGLSPAAMQQFQAAQARTAQGVASSGGVGAIQAGVSQADLYQRLRSQDQANALALLGAGTPIMSNAINTQLQGTNAGLQAQLSQSQNAGQAAMGLFGALAKLYG